MTLVRWDPFRELEDMSERLNRVFSRPPLRNSGKENLTVADWMPTVDISETEGEYLIKAELPEVRKEDVKVTVENGVLTLQGERRQEKEEKGKRFHRVERSYGSFVRSFTLPESVDESSRQSRIQRRRVESPPSEVGKSEAESDRRESRLITSLSDQPEGPPRRAFLLLAAPLVYPALEHDQFPTVLVQIQPQDVPLTVAGGDPEIAVRVAVPAIHDLLARAVSCPRG